MNLSSSHCHRRRPAFQTFLCLLLASALAGSPAVYAQKAGAAKKKEAAAGGGSRKGRKMPSDAELKALIRQTLLDLDSGLETKDFTKFYATLAPTTRKSFTKEQIAGFYAGQIAQDQRTDYAAKTEAVFDPAPAIDAQGVLTLSGHLPSEPQWVVFRVKYLDEGGWKPYAMVVRVQNSDYAPTRLPNPGEKELPPGKVKDPNAPVAASTPAPSVAPTPGYVSPFAAPAPSAATPASSPAAVTPAPSPTAK